MYFFLGGGGGGSGVPVYRESYLPDDVCGDLWSLQQCGSHAALQREPLRAAHVDVHSGHVALHMLQATNAGEKKQKGDTKNKESGSHCYIDTINTSVRMLGDEEAWLMSQTRLNKICFVNAWHEKQYRGPSPLRSIFPDVNSWKDKRVKGLKPREVCSMLQGAVYGNSKCHGLKEGYPA